MPAGQTTATSTETVNTTQIITENAALKDGAAVAALGKVSEDIQALRSDELTGPKGQSLALALIALYSEVTWNFTGAQENIGKTCEALDKVRGSTLGEFAGDTLFAAFYGMYQAKESFKFENQHRLASLVQDRDETPIYFGAGFKSSPLIKGIDSKESLETVVGNALQTVRDDIASEQDRAQALLTLAACYYPTRGANADQAMIDVADNGMKEALIYLAKNKDAEVIQSPAMKAAAVYLAIHFEPTTKLSKEEFAEFTQPGTQQGLILTLLCMSPRFSTPKQRNNPELRAGLQSNKIVTAFLAATDATA